MFILEKYFKEECAILKMTRSEGVFETNFLLGNKTLYITSIGKKILVKLEAVQKAENTIVKPSK